MSLEGLVVTAQYSDGTIKAVTDYRVSGYDSSRLGSQEITVSYGDFARTFTVTVAEEPEPGATLTGIVLSALPDKLEYARGEALSLKGLVVTAQYSN